jgi:DNA-binding NtrC family response regulator
MNVIQARRRLQDVYDLLDDAIRGLREPRPLADLEREAFHTSLASAKGNRSIAAQLLGVSRRTLYNLINRHGEIGRVSELDAIIGKLENARIEIAHLLGATDA